MLILFSHSWDYLMRSICLPVYLSPALLTVSPKLSCYPSVYTFSCSCLSSIFTSFGVSSDFFVCSLSALFERIFTWSLFCFARFFFALGSTWVWIIIVQSGHDRTSQRRCTVYCQVLAAQGRCVHESEKTLSCLNQCPNNDRSAAGKEAADPSEQVSWVPYLQCRLALQLQFQWSFCPLSGTSDTGNWKVWWHSGHLPILLNTVLVQVCYELSKVVYGHTPYRMSAWMGYGWRGAMLCHLFPRLHYLRLWFGFWSTYIWMGSSPQPWSAPVGGDHAIMLYRSLTTQARQTQQSISLLVLKSKLAFRRVWSLGTTPVPVNWNWSSSMHFRVSRYMIDGCPSYLHVTRVKPVMTNQLVAPTITLLLTGSSMVVPLIRQKTAGGAL